MAGLAIARVVAHLVTRVGPRLVGNEVGWGLELRRRVRHLRRHVGALGLLRCGHVEAAAVVAPLPGGVVVVAVPVAVWPAVFGAAVVTTAVVVEAVAVIGGAVGQHLALRHGTGWRGAGCQRAARVAVLGVAPKAKARCGPELGPGDLLLRRPHAVLPHRPALAEGVGVHHRHRLRCALVAVAARAGLVAAVAVDVVHVVRAGAVVRPPSFARAEWEPAHARLAAAHLEAKTHTGVAADKTHQRRCVHRPPHHRARHPAPAAAHVSPAAVVERRKAPGRVVDPGPAPGRDVGPVAIAVGRPVGHHRTRVPDRTVGGVVAPVAVLVKLLVANGLARHVAGANGNVFLPVAFGDPSLEVVALAHTGHRNGRQVGAGKRHLLRHSQRVGHAVFAISGARAGQHRHAGGVAHRVHVDAVLARLGHTEGEVGRVHLQAFALEQVAHPQAERALGELELGHVVVQRQHVDAGGAVQPHRGGANVQLAAGTFGHPDAVATGQRPVQQGVGPVVTARFGGADGPLDQADPRHPPGGVLCRVGADVGLRPGGAGQQPSHEQAGQMPWLQKIGHGSVQEKVPTRE